MNLIGTTMDDVNNEKIHMSTYMSALYFMCMPFSIVPIPGGGSLLKYISYLVGVYLILNLFFRNVKIQFNSVHLLLALYSLYSIGSILLLNTELSVLILRGTLQTSLIFYLITINIYNDKEFKLLLHCWIIVGIVTSVIMIFGSIALKDASGRVTLGIGAGREDANQLCGYFILPILCCFEKVKNKDKWAIVYIGLGIAIMYTIFATGSRGGLIAILGVIAAYVFFFR